MHGGHPFYKKKPNTPTPASTTRSKTKPMTSQHQTLFFGLYLFVFFLVPIKCLKGSKVTALANLPKKNIDDCTFSSRQEDPVFLYYLPSKQQVHSIKAEFQFKWFNSTIQYLEWYFHIYHFDQWVFGSKLATTSGLFFGSVENSAAKWASRKKLNKGAQELNDKLPW